MPVRSIAEKSEACQLPDMKTISKTEARAQAEDGIKEAQDNLDYYRRHAAIDMDPAARAKAAGLAGIWKTTLAARVKAYNEEFSTQPKP